MEEEDKHSFLQPLIPSSSSNENNDPSNNLKLFKNNNHNNIILRILVVFLVALISLWANYEASKTFAITIVNDAKDSLAGHRFALSYVSNDKATRIILNTSSFVQHFLYPINNDHCPEKNVTSVTLRLTRQNLTTTVSAGERFNSYVVDISHKLLEDDQHYNNKMAIVGAVQLAMARVWLYDGGSTAPSGLIDGMAEYVAEVAGFRRERVSVTKCDGGRAWWVDMDPRVVVGYLHYCERYKKGFIQRLNQALRDTWHDRMVDDVLGMPASKLCGLYDESSFNLI
ncbi:hypothetical protein TanjilG_15167 [Lupinus angustifolius]|uniref:Uncharacterized protein n=1 Tax=Lupinus angustifolius TaxID=3871 RepID=A0A1J7H612_LUPAN|nr:PREDICTED: uncharacterized protein LOC109352290 [Lupinus angustifolius]OIW08206.1 hypothetical protein TanjilG_15167 [Lupinus angustifolius]